MLKNKRKTCQERERKEKGYIRLKKNNINVNELVFNKKVKWM